MVLLFNRFVRFFDSLPFLFDRKKSLKVKALHQEERAKRKAADSKVEQLEEQLREKLALIESMKQENSDLQEQLTQAKSEHQADCEMLVTIIQKNTEEETKRSSEVTAQKASILNKYKEKERDLQQEFQMKEIALREDYSKKLSAV